MSVDCSLLAIISHSCFYLEAWQYKPAYNDIVVANMNSQKEGTAEMAEWLVCSNSKKKGM